MRKTFNPETDELLFDYERYAVIKAPVGVDGVVELKFGDLLAVMRESLTRAFTIYWELYYIDGPDRVQRLPEAWARGEPKPAFYAVEQGQQVRLNNRTVQVDLDGRANFSFIEVQQ